MYRCCMYEIVDQLPSFSWELVKGLPRVDDAFDATRISEVNDENYVRTLRMLINNSDV
jgi:hypothetical protein